MDQVITTVLAVIGSLAAMLVFILRLIVPWMKTKIDVKNGEISELVKAVRDLTGAILTGIREGSAEQQARCEAHCDKIDELIEVVKEATERAT